jgi:hypothetical protein
VIPLEALIKLAKDDPNSLFVHYLSKSNPDVSKVEKLVNVLKKEPKHVGAIFALDHILRPFHIMKYLDSCLESIKDQEKLGKFVAHLTEKDSFWQGYCEIEVAANIKKLFGKIELEPKLPNEKSVDIKFPLGSDEIFAEITAPKRSYKFIERMRESVDTGQVVQLEAPAERASEKIIAELNHFAKILEEVHSIIIINLNETEIEDIDIEDAILGVSSLLVQTNRVTREVITKVKREEWNAFYRNADLSKIGAVICYKRDFALNGKISYEKKMFIMSFKEDKYQPLSKLF